MGSKTYNGTDIDITFDMKRCIHARNCFLKLPDVFDPNRRPWVEPDAAPAEEIAAMIRTCPSGALGFNRADGTGEAPPKINRITVLENGPLSLSGDMGDGETRKTLCRCGKSKNKPYCDYSHVEVDFTATGEPAPQSPESEEESGGPFTATPIPSGPLKVEGHHELTTGTGRRIAKLDKSFLCRCGASQNKPYCDGSHKEIDFTGD